MKEAYKPELKVYVSLDDKQRTHAIRHSQERQEFGPKVA
jgi:hypothetical protein